MSRNKLYMVKTNQISKFQSCKCQREYSTNFINQVPWSISFFGYPLSSGLAWPSQSGPLCHNILSASSEGFIPLEGMSAGLPLPGHCRQEFGLTRFRISITRFCTNCFHSRFSFLIQNNATFESVQQTESCNCNSWHRASSTSFSNLARMRQDNSSSRGIVCLSMGALLSWMLKILRMYCWQF